MWAKLAVLGAGCVLLAGAALAGCGESDEAGSASSVRETVDPLPTLPKNWKRHVNRGGGFAVGVPPRWSARTPGRRSELRSPDRLVAVSIAANRTDDSLEVPLRELARTTLKAGLPGVRKIDPGKPRRLRHRYEAVTLVAKAMAGRNPPVEERLTLAVIRRRDLATYTALVAENADVRGRPYREQIERLLRSLRGRPIGARRGAG